VQESDPKERAIKGGKDETQDGALLRRSDTKHEQSRNEGIPREKNFKKGGVGGEGVKKEKIPPRKREEAITTYHI